MNTSSYYVIFLVPHLYYIPQFTPIAFELQKRNKKLLFLIEGKDTHEQIKISENFCTENDFDYITLDKEFPKLECRFLINGAHNFPNYPIKYEYTASIQHGIGTKSGYYAEVQNLHDIRFVEGYERVNKLKKLYPNSETNLFDVGLAKLDTAVNLSDKDKESLILKYKLDPTKLTILYAPTFYPSSIENMPKYFPSDLSDYNIIVKPHFFSFLKKKYKHHLKKFDKWVKYPNVYFATVEEFDLCPFMAVSDLMLTDESSAMFEFAALNKPVIINRNVKFRLSYRIFKSKIAKRMDSEMSSYHDIGISVFKYKDVLKAIDKESKDPERMSVIRKKLSGEIVGEVDGKASIRIVDVLENYSK